jgi:phosphomannomutase
VCCCVLQVALPQDFVPTPFVAAGVSLLGCACGIMVTASHNSKEYNGYKVRELMRHHQSPRGGSCSRGRGAQASSTKHTM